MARWLVGRNGIVENVVGGATAPIVASGFDVVLDPTDAVNVGGSYDPKDVSYDKSDTVALQVLFRHENLIRELIRGLRASSAAANTAATTAGLPTTANSADLTVPQFKAAVKALLS